MICLLSCCLNASCAYQLIGQVSTEDDAIHLRNRPTTNSDVIEKSRVSFWGDNSPQSLTDCEMLVWKKVQFAIAYCNCIFEDPTLVENDDTQEISMQIPQVGFAGFWETTNC